MGVNGKALQLHVVLSKAVFLITSHENSYQVLQVTRAASEREMKSKVRMIKSLSPQYQAENSITRLLPLAFLLMLHTHNSI